jgi:ADP-ribosyl-[dinitrogen reductase] hydrolase
MFLNGVCGDVYGAPIEMMPHECIIEKYGLIDRYIENTNNNTLQYSWTDDTQMTISVIDCIKNENEITNENIFKYYLKYFEPSRKFSRNIYNMFLNYYETGNIIISDRISNGGLMRVSPLIKIYDSKNIEKLVTIIHYPTHLNELSIKVSIVYLNILNYLYISDCTLKEFIEYLKTQELKNLEYILLNIDNDEFELANYAIGLDGILCYETLLCALIAFIKNFDNPKLIIQKAITYGGDTDTIGSIAGQLSGIRFGNDALNEEWLEKIDNLEYIKNISSFFN